MKISDRLAGTLAVNNVIDKDDLEIYAYGLRGLGMLSLCTLTLFVIGILMNQFLFTLSFFLSYTTLRAFYEGYHAKSRVICFVFSSALFLICTVINQHLIPGSGTDYIIFLLFIVLNILKMKDYMDKRKEEQIKKRDTKKLMMGIALFVFFLLLYYLMRYWDLTNMVNGIFMAVLCVFTLHMMKRMQQLKN